MFKLQTTDRPLNPVKGMNGIQKLGDSDGGHISQYLLQMPSRNRNLQGESKEETLSSKLKDVLILVWHAFTCSFPFTSSFPVGVVIINEWIALLYTESKSMFTQPCAWNVRVFMHSF